MQDRSFFFTFLSFLVVSFLILFLVRVGVLSGPTSFIYGVSSHIKVLGSASTLSNLAEENLKLKGELSQEQKILSENAALRDQFAGTSISSKRLLPATIVGVPSFLPGITEPESLIIDKGLDSGVLVGQAVIFENNLIGRISKASGSVSRVELITASSFSATAKIASNSDSSEGILGVVKGEGGGQIILDNVLLSAKLTKNQTVVTKGDISQEGIGIPADIIVGRTISIEKRASDIFQKARVESQIDAAHLSTVFVIVQ